MPTYSISYDLHAPGRNYAALHEAIKSYGTWVKPLESHWIIQSMRSATEVRDHLLHYIDKNDSLVVLGLNGQWSAYASTNVLEWMQKVA